MSGFNLKGIYRLIVSTTDSTVLGAGDQCQFVVSEFIGRDESGNHVSNPSDISLSWSANAPNGLYTAPDTIPDVPSPYDNVILTATWEIVGEDVTATFRYSISETILLRPVCVEILPKYVSPYSKGFVQFTGIARNAHDPAVTWTVSSGGWMLDNSGLYVGAATLLPRCSAFEYGSTAIVRATSVEDPTKFSEAIVELRPGFPAGDWLCSDGQRYHVTEDGTTYNAASENVGMPAYVWWGSPVLP